MYESWLENQIYRHVPEYYHGMERDGFNFHEVKYAWTRQLFKEREEKRKAEEYQKALNTAVSKELRHALDLAMKDIRNSLK